MEFNGKIRGRRRSNNRQNGEHSLVRGCSCRNNLLICVYFPCFGVSGGISNAVTYLNESCLNIVGSFGDDFIDYRLSEQDAVELLRELENPAQVALFIMESDDVTGFLRSVQMLLDQGFVRVYFQFSNFFIIQTELIGMKVSLKVEEKF